MQSTDEKYMKEAIKQAKKAYAIGEVPIGCVIVYQDKIIGRGYNRRTIDNNTLAHAELIAIAAIQIKIPYLMQSLMLSERQVKSWETGVWRDAPCM